MGRNNYELSDHIYGRRRSAYGRYQKIGEQGDRRPLDLGREDPTVNRHGSCGEFNNQESGFGWRDVEIGTGGHGPADDGGGHLEFSQKRGQPRDSAAAYIP